MRHPRDIDLPLTVDRTSGVPLGEQLVRQVRDLVARGVLRPGDPLPSSRALAARLGEMLQQQLADTATLMGVIDEERDLGLGLARGVVTADRDDFVVLGDDERDPAVVVDLGESLDVAL